MNKRSVLKFVKSKVIDLAIKPVLQPVPRLIVRILAGDKTVHEVGEGIDTPFFLNFPTGIVEAFQK